MIAKVRLPIEESAFDISEYQQSNKEAGGIGVSDGDYKIEIETKILHDGEVNRARYMPQAQNIIATKPPKGEVHIFDYTKHFSKPDTNTVNPQLILEGHSEEGYGLSWNPLKKGYLLSGGNDEKICLWDIEKSTQLNEKLQPINQNQFHKGVVGDVCWHKFKEDIFASCGDDRYILIWDIRQDFSKPTHQILGHINEIYSVDFCPLQEYLFLSGSADKTVALWDLRNTSKKLHQFEGHTDEVIKAEWSPFNISIFSSCSSDKRAIIWDISKIGEEMKAEDAKDGPPEMLFIHGGHRAKIPDMSWNPNDQLVIASVEEENNFLQIWQMNETIYQDADAEKELEMEIEKK